MTCLQKDITNKIREQSGQAEEEPRQEESLDTSAASNETATDSCLYI